MEILGAGTVEKRGKDKWRLRITAEDFMVMFMDCCKNTRGCTKRTLAGYDQMIRCRINPHLGHVLLSDLTPYMLEEFFTQQRESGGANGGALSANTNRKTFSMFKTALKHAVYLELIPKNPLELLQGPSVKKTSATPSHRRRAYARIRALEGLPR